MSDISLVEERKVLQQIKSSILIKAETAQAQSGEGKSNEKYVHHCYLRAAALEMEIAEMLKQEGKEKKIHPGIISAISCYLKGDDYSNALRVLKQYYPKDSNEYNNIEVIRELWKGVGELFMKLKLKDTENSVN